MYRRVTKCFSKGTLLFHQGAAVPQSGGESTVDLMKRVSLISGSRGSDPIKNICLEICGVMDVEGHLKRCRRMHVASTRKWSLLIMHNELPPPPTARLIYIALWRSWWVGRGEPFDVLGGGGGTRTVCEVRVVSGGSDYCSVVARGLCWTDFCHNTNNAWTTLTETFLTVFRPGCAFIQLTLA
jgi:hypothetical protein